MSELFTRGRDFIYRDGRLLERRLFARLFEGGPASAVVDCLRSYRNTDGGLGHALEPDKRAPESQPLDVQIALDTLDAAGTFDAGLVGSACDFLESVADERGAVPVVLPSIADYPRAHHWRDGNFPPGPSPAVGIAALLYKHGFEHAWRERASDYCWSVIENEPPDDAHALRECMAFVEHAPDRTRAEAAANGLAEALGKARWFNADSDYDGYGLTPLHFATTPHSRWRALFADSRSRRT